MTYGLLRKIIGLATLGLSRKMIGLTTCGFSSLQSLMPALILCEMSRIKILVDTALSDHNY